MIDYVKKSTANKNEKFRLLFQTGHNATGLLISNLQTNSNYRSKIKPNPILSTMLSVMHLYKTFASPSNMQSHQSVVSCLNYQAYCIKVPTETQFSLHSHFQFTNLPYVRHTPFTSQSNLLTCQSAVHGFSFRGFIKSYPLTQSFLTIVCVFIAFWVESLKQATIMVYQQSSTS